MYILSTWKWFSWKPTLKFSATFSGRLIFEITNAVIHGGSRTSASATPAQAGRSEYGWLPVWPRFLGQTGSGRPCAFVPHFDKSCSYFF
jgi:hypothetical protein